jgi:hypothetical protein
VFVSWFDILISSSRKRASPDLIYILRFESESGLPYYFNNSCDSIFACVQMSTSIFVSMMELLPAE